MKQFNNKTIHNKGFSIIELIVAISLFVIVISISVSIFLRTLRTQKTALLLIEANNNLSLTIEEMSREIRESTDFKSTDFNGPKDIFRSNIEFTDTMTGEFIKYDFINGAIFKTVNGVQQQLTSNAITITDFKIKLIQPANFPSRVLVSITASPNSDVLTNYTDNIQTTVSSRMISI